MSEFHLNHRYKGVTTSTAINIFDMVTWLILKGWYFDWVTWYFLFRFYCAWFWKRILACLLVSDASLFYLILNVFSWIFNWREVTSMFWSCRIFVYCRFNKYFTFVINKKLHFSLNYSFYSCLVIESWALEVA